MTTPQTRLQAGGIELDLLDSTVTVDGGDVHFSPKEFALLRLLMQHLGETVTRAAILGEIWDAPDRTRANIVDQYVSYLRKKLGGSEAGVRIVTERGVGFRLSET
ncbi:MAG: winged helix-turn-helix domain-containing protein [Leucobacter sp.]